MTEWVVVLHPLPSNAWLAILLPAMLLWLGGIILGADSEPGCGCVLTVVALLALLAVLLNGSGML